MDKNDLIKLIDEGLSTRKIGERLGRGQCATKYWLKKYGLKTKHSLRNCEKKCVVCKNKLVGNHTRFCSLKCKNNHYNSWHNSADRQKQKGITRKLELLEFIGKSKCEKCGYNKNIAAISFHHKDPSKKDFGIDQRACSLFSMKRLKEEALKCEVLCMNCHMETHYPQHKMVDSVGFEPTIPEL